MILKVAPENVQKELKKTADTQMSHQNSLIYRHSQ